jgi:predicted metal-binding membrane protein
MLTKEPTIGMTSIASGAKSNADFAGERGFFAISALLVMVSTTVTIYWCGTMSGGMAMPGGWTMSMAWMRMPGQSWFAAAGMFIGMWAVMMMAMMLPSLMAQLRAYRHSARDLARVSLGELTLLAGAAYLLVWIALGALLYPMGVLVATLQMRSEAVSRSVPLLSWAALVLAGCIQLTAWKTAQLRRCREAPECATPLVPDARGAFRYGLRQGLHCCQCCCGFTLILLVFGVMDLRVMAAVGVALSVERLAPRPERVARALGVAVLAAALVQGLRAV